MPNSSSRKKAVNVSIDAELAAEAKEAGTNMSALLEKALQEELRAHRIQKWREENREAIEDYNRYIEEVGLLSDHFGKWK